MMYCFKNGWACIHFIDAACMRRDFEKNNSVKNSHGLGLFLLVATPKL